MMTAASPKLKARESWTANRYRRKGLAWTKAFADKLWSTVIRYSKVHELDDRSHTFQCVWSSSSICEEDLRWTHLRRCCPIACIRYLHYCSLPHIQHLFATHHYSHRQRDRSCEQELAPLSIAAANLRARIPAVIYVHVYERSPAWWSWQPRPPMASIRQTFGGLCQRRQFLLFVRLPVPRCAWPSGTQQQRRMMVTRWPPCTVQCFVVTEYDLMLVLRSHGRRQRKRRIRKCPSFRRPSSKR